MILRQSRRFCSQHYGSKIREQQWLLQSMDSSSDYQASESPQNNNENSNQVSKVSSDAQEDYTANINELISQPSVPSTTQLFLQTLFELSHYLFSKKLQVRRSESSQIFDDYLGSVSKEISIYEGLHKKAKQSSKNYKLEIQQSAEELMQCYQKVPYAFFNQKFILDFSQLARNITRIKERQEQLNDHLDIVQINLFSQIHHKFHQYFKVVSNFDYLNQSLQVNIAKSREARSSMRKVKIDFVEKSYKLKLKITHKQNIEKTLKLLKIVKSLKKLPSIIKQILESSLPYECLSLLKSTKESLNQVSTLKCLDKVSQTIRQSESLVQMGLSKRYTDQLYLYLEQCQNVPLEEAWDRINSNNCIDMSGLNNSLLGASGFLEESVLEMQPSGSKNKRNQGKQFEIAMILLESYKFMNFPVDLIRIKVANSLRVFCKKFDTQLTDCLKRILLQKNENILKNSQEDENSEQKITNININEDSQSGLSEVTQKITVIFYVKHLWIFNEIMKDTIDRFLGYLHTLLTEFNESKIKDAEKFASLFKDELSILSAISKILIDKLKALMSLKNINGISFVEFKQWVSVLEYWRKYTDSLIQDNPLINTEVDNDQVEEAINEAFKKMVGTFNINNTINELVLNYVSSYQQNVIDTELEPAFAEETWQPVEIPSEFVEVLNNITQWHEQFVCGNVSVSILNDSKQIKNMSREVSQDYSNALKKTNKFRVLKSNVMVDGVRFKISISFLLLCEFIEEYVKMTRSLPECRKFIFEKILSLVEYYNSRTRELILEAKARQFEKMKSKNISAKHICLVHNCLSVVSKLVREINYPEVRDLKQLSLDNIQTHKSQLIGKLSYLIKSKVESTVTAYFIGKDQKPSQTNLSLLNVFVQMMGIVDDFLQFDDKRAVFKDSMEIFVTKYFKQLLLKGSEYVAENRMLVEKMRFLRQYFPDELDVMQREVKVRSSFD